MAKNQFVSGVHGWLRLLVVGLTILGPLFAIGRTAQLIKESEERNPAIVQTSQWKQ